MRTALVLSEKTMSRVYCVRLEQNGQTTVVSLRAQSPSGAIVRAVRAAMLGTEDGTITATVDGFADADSVMRALLGEQP
jgi:hypothetical protein